MGGYVELQCKSNFSFLEGASHPAELVSEALEKGLSGLALGDRNGVYGVAKAYQVAKNAPHFKFIIGAELHVENCGDLLFLVRDRSAYGWLCRLITKAHEGKEKGCAQLQWQQLEPFFNESSIKGVVLLPRDLSSLTDFSSSTWGPLKDVFAERLYYPLTRYLDGRDQKRTDRALDMENRWGVSLVATNDVHYHKKPRKAVHDVLTSIKEGQALYKAGFSLHSNAERYLKSAQQMETLFKDLPQALHRTLEIAESCTFSLSELKYRYPSEWIPEHHTAQSYLEELVWQGSQERYREGLPEAVNKQLIHELKLINQLHFADYFLTIYDVVQFARSRKILCQGRGSAANSVVCYVLGITAVDPVQMKLLFERFISVERGETPDIDVDFEHERREEVIQYIYEKYGRDRAAMVSAVVTYQKRLAFREVSKSFGINVSTLSSKKVKQSFSDLAPSSKLGQGDAQALRDKIDLITEEMIGFPRHLSIHSGGFTLSADPIIETVPVEPARMEGRTIIQWDKYDLEELGLLKVDILSLGMLSALRKTLDMVGLELYTIPQDDKPTYEMIQKADTVGTFQIESRAQMSMLGRLQPKNFYDLVVEVAIVRPGPIIGQMVHPYLRRRRGLEKIHYPHPAVEDILGRTLGVPLFQEQVMKLAIQLAGFTPGEADLLRRAIGAWRSSGSIHKMGEKLREGLLRSGISEDFAAQFFEQIKGFAHYGFPESHAASFAHLAYASAYLKCHYPGPFLCALVSSQPMGFYQNHTLVNDALRHGVEVLPVSLWESKWDCHLHEGDLNKVRLGLRVIKGLGERTANLLIEERNKRPFSSVWDILRRVHLPREVWHRLALAGALDGAPREVLWQLLSYELLLNSPQKNQLSLFRHAFEEQPFSTSALSFKPLDTFEEIQADFSSYGLTTRDHPMKILRQRLKSLPRITSKEVKKKEFGSQVEVGGLTIVRQKPPTAKGVMFSTMEDENGFLDLIFHPPVLKKYEETILNHSFLIVKGKVQRDEYTCQVLVEKVKPIWKTKSYSETPLPIDAHQYF